MEFVKHASTPRGAECEAAGLRWLREASKAVVTVQWVDAAKNTLGIAFVDRCNPTREAARQAGRELAYIHDSGAEAFGCPPPGWTGPNYIGTQAQACRPDEQWGRFYADQRVAPFAQEAVRRGNMSTEGLSDVEKCLDVIRSLSNDEAPSRIHGDLWAGNLLFGPGGPVFIDPAAHGGHRETDLAMLALFGAPRFEDVIAGYEEVYPLRAGWRERVPMHQLHPLAVHAVTHGAYYGQALQSAAREVLDWAARTM